MFPSTVAVAVAAGLRAPGLSAQEKGASPRREWLKQKPDSLVSTQPYKLPDSSSYFCAHVCARVCVCVCVSVCLSAFLCVCLSMFSQLIFVCFALSRLSCAACGLFA